MLLVYTHDGSVQGILSHKGNLLLGVSTLSLGRDKALTTEHIAADSAEGDWLYDGAFTNATSMQEYWGFGSASCKPGDLPVPAATCGVLLIPHWLPIALGSLSLIWHARRFTFRTRERKWMKEGRCLTCGYDLRGTPSPRCPECGTETELLQPLAQRGGNMPLETIG